MSNSRTCTTPGCNEPRWLGPSGNNHKLVKCEAHQKADWRKQKNPKGQGEKQKRGPKPGSKRSKQAALTQPAASVKRLIIDRQTDTIIMTCVMNLSDLKSNQNPTKLARFIGFWKQRGFEVEDRPAKA